MGQSRSSARSASSPSPDPAVRVKQLPSESFADGTASPERRVAPRFPSGLSLVERALVHAAYHCRAAAAWDMLRRRRVKLLIYHGISSRPASDAITNRFGYNVPVHEFERQVEYLRSRCHVVRLDDALSGRGLRRSRINVVLTFDDGYENNFTNAFRILRRFELPAVFALTTGFVRDRVPLWNDVVEFLVARAAPARVTLAWDGDETSWDLAETDGPSGRAALYERLLVLATTVQQERRAELVRTASEALGVPIDHDAIFAVEDYRPMTVEQVREMSASGLVEFAAHNVQHFLLTRAQPETRRAELADSKRHVEEWIDVPCSTFCVPGGAYDAATVNEAFELGFERILTSDGGFGVPGQRFVGRSGILQGMSPPEFADLVHGPVGALTRRVRSMLAS